MCIRDRYGFEKNAYLLVFGGKGREKDMKLYQAIEKLALEIIAEKRYIYKGVSPNVDFYSGFVYDMLGIPQELYTPLFAVARIVGWSAHRIEELIDMDKIIRPAYMSVMEEKELRKVEGLWTSSYFFMMTEKTAA